MFKCLKLTLLFLVFSEKLLSKNIYHDLYASHVVLEDDSIWNESLSEEDKNQLERLIDMAHRLEKKSFSAWSPPYYKDFLVYLDEYLKSSKVWFTRANQSDLRYLLQDGIKACMDCHLRSPLLPKELDLKKLERLTDLKKADTLLLFQKREEAFEYYEKTLMQAELDQDAELWLKAAKGMLYIFLQRHPRPSTIFSLVEALEKRPLAPSTKKDLITWKKDAMSWQKQPALLTRQQNLDEAYKLENSSFVNIWRKHKLAQKLQVNYDADFLLWYAKQPNLEGFILRPSSYHLAEVCVRKAEIANTRKSCRELLAEFFSGFKAVELPQLINFRKQSLQKMN